MRLMNKASKAAATTRKNTPSDAVTGSRRDGAVARAKLLEKAMQEFADKGLDARVEDISDAVGTNRRMAYYYFGSKEGLYLAALEATYLELVEAERVIDVEQAHTTRMVPKRIDELRGPLNSIARKVVKRGQELGVMRQNIDPLELYVAICALGFYAFSNQYTLGTMFGVDLMAPDALKKRKQMMIDMVTAYVTSGNYKPVETM